MLVILLVVIGIIIYSVLKLPEIKKAEEERIKARIRAENLKKKIRRIKQQKP